MKMTFWLTIGSVAVLGVTMVQGQDARFTFDDAASVDALLPSPPQVSVTWDSGALKVEFTGTVESVPLVRVPLTGVDKPYVYRARIKSADLSSQAYLEMWSEFGDASYFSRALDQPLTGDTDWRQCEAPFFLQPSDPRPQSATLGIRMEGPGTVWIDDMTLQSMVAAPVLAESPNTVGWATASGLGWSRFWRWASALFGILAGCWGAAVGYFAPRGQGQPVILAVGIAFIAAGICSLLYGIWAAFTLPILEAIPALVLGGVDLIMFLPLMYITRRRYREAEMRRMQAMDVA